MTLLILISHSVEFLALITSSVICHCSSLYNRHSSKTLIESILFSIYSLISLSELNFFTQSPSFNNNDINKLLTFLPLLFINNKSFSSISLLYHGSFLNEVHSQNWDEAGFSLCLFTLNAENIVAGKITENLPIRFQFADVRHIHLVVL